MSPIVTVEKEEIGTIMSTVIYIKIVDNSNLVAENDLRTDIDLAFNLFTDFQNNYSRFIRDNELDLYNKGIKTGNLSFDFLEMVKIGEQFNKISGGVFSIHVLRPLIKIGYSTSKDKGFTAHAAIPDQNLKLRTDAIDFGGLGKGYITDKVTKILNKKYKNFVVDAGGDISFVGGDLENNPDHWVVGIEDPISGKDFMFLQAKNLSIATSTVKKGLGSLMGKGNTI